MKRVMYHDMRLVHVNGDKMQEFLTTNSVGIVIDVDLNAKN